MTDLVDTNPRHLLSAIAAHGVKLLVLTYDTPEEARAAQQTICDGRHKRALGKSGRSAYGRGNEYQWRVSRLGRLIVVHHNSIPRRDALQRAAKHTAGEEVIQEVIHAE